MVQILPPVDRPTFAQKLNAGIGHGLEMGQQLMQQNQQRQSIIDLLGEQYANLPPEFQQLALQSKLRREEMGQKLQGESEIEGRDYDVVKNTFGEKFANLWRSQSPDARNALVRAGIESAQRGMNLEEMLGGLQQMPIEDQEQEPIIDLTQKPSIKTKDFDRGLTPSERTKRQEGRYKTNLPLFQQSTQKRQAYETLKDELGVLEELSPQIKGFERININPKTGELIIPALASTEAQRYVKTINDLTRSAKDTYGSRVTNFDLAQFLKRLPTLANSKEGREDILRQLGLINDVNIAKEKSLQDILEEHGGIRNIDFDKAETLAEKRSEKQIAKLRKEFNSIGKDLDKQEEKNIKDFKSIIPKDRVAVRNSDGTIGHIPKDKVKEYLSDQAGEVL